MDMPDEDTLVIPNAWRRKLHPRRGGSPVPAAVIDESAVRVVDALVKDTRSEIKQTLRHKETAPELSERARAHLDGEANPVGAAVVAAIATVRSGKRGVETHALLADAWAAEHGIAFAACAYAELSVVLVEYSYLNTRRPWRGVRYWRTSDHGHRLWAHEPIAHRFRTVLATADERDYEEAVARLADHRRDVMQRMAVSYLVPTRQDWVDECCATPLPTYGPGHGPLRESWMLYCALGSPEQLDRLGGPVPVGQSFIWTMVDGVGSAVAPLLAESLDNVYTSIDIRKGVTDALARLPTDEAFQALVDRIDQKHVPGALLAAMKRYPVRALRLLAPAAVGTSKTAARVTELLDGHLLANPELTGAAALPGLPDEARAAVESIAAAAVRVEEADDASLPRLLVEPPWTRKRKAAKPVVIEGVTPHAASAVAWMPGEREKWAATPRSFWYQSQDDDWKKKVKQFRRGYLQHYQQADLFLDGPEELVRPLLPDWKPEYLWEAGDWMRPLVARFGLDALPVALRAARWNPASCGGLLLPYLDAEVALLAAGWTARLKAARRVAFSWFGRHGMAAVPLLLPAALGKPGAERRGAETALRHLAGRHGAEGIVDAARARGDGAADAIASTLATDPLEILPTRTPKPGDWADPSLLPQVLLRGRDRALPPAATGHLITMLAMSKPGEVYPGIEVVRETCDPESLAGFAWALFQRWEAYGAPSRDGWALTALGRLGDDETVRRLTPVIRAWPGDGGHAKAVNGLDVLAEIGTDVALMHLHGIAQKVKFKGLRTRAQEKIDEVAAGLRLTPEQLADRLVPDFGLDTDGSLTLDYGPRRFVVGFDEQLRPYVADEDGKRRQALPKPGAKDDAELAPAAKKRFAALKKDVRTVAADQIRRLESAMVARRRWPESEFRDFFVHHPLVWHIARRLVWIAEDGGKPVAFRVAEDRTFADVKDDVLTLAASAEVGIVHPLDLGDALGTWSEVFADYEILQPFPQLGRAVHTLTEEERAADRLRRFEGLRVPFGRVLGLERRGWERGEPLDAGVERWISRRVADGRYVMIDLDPGIAAGAADTFDEQTLVTVRLSDQLTDPMPDRPSAGRFGDLDPVVASEVLAALTELAESAL